MNSDFWKKKLQEREREGEKEVSIFLTVIAPKLPQKPAAMTYAQSTTALQSHYQPKPLVIVDRTVFRSTINREGSQWQVISSH